jgi:hypothetical protein
MNDGGTQVKNILVPLAQRGDEVPVDHAVSRKVLPSHDHQTDISFKVYRLDRRICEVSETTKRTFLLDDSIADDVSAKVRDLHVAGLSPAATVDVNIGKKGSRLDREAKVEIYFGRTEVSVTASSRIPGEIKRASIRWDGSGVLAADGSGRR